MRSAAAEHGQKSLIFMFEESSHAPCPRPRRRARSSHHEKAGLIRSATLTPPMSHRASLHSSSAAVEEQGVQLIVIDSLNGYLNAMPDEKHLALHLHELLAYAAARGVAVLMVISQLGMMGQSMQQPVDAELPRRHA